MALLKQTKITKPDFVELSLIIVFVAWIIAILWLLRKVITFQIISLFTIESLSTIFLTFITLILLVIAIILADIRKELKNVY
jgi:Kef-type K+ transport system membrane component KefB